MKQIQNILLIISLIIFFNYTGNGQTRKKFNPLKDDISDMVPPLGVLIDSAFENDPGLKFAEMQVDIDKCNLKTEKSQWTQDLGLQANVGYGSFDYLYNNNIGGTTQQTTTLKQNETQYGVGGFFRLPLYDLVNHRNQVRQAKTVMAQAATLSDSRKNQIREDVIKQYNDMLVKQRQLKIKSKYLETARINMQMAEKGFVNGAISVDDYSRVSEIGARTETDFEAAKMDFVTAYMILEVLTGIKFNLTNEIQLKNESN
jgi:outer membrane protein TolC